MYKNYFKRILDFTLALILLTLLAPVILLLMFLIRIKLGKSVFFLQARGGLNGKIFNIIKFRTMLNTKDSSGNLLPDEQRLTAFGKILRKLSLDELPSLINVLKGDVSFIGPRPFIADYLNYYNDYQKQRHNVRPGITGWAQINGRNSISWEEKFELDIWYVKNLSFLLDVKILILTFFKLFNPSGINNPQHATMPRFTGSK